MLGQSEGRGNVRILIVGTGSIGRRHISSLQKLVPNAQFTFVRRNGEIDDYAKQVGAAVTSSLDEALAQTPSLAVIANPSAYHFEVLRQMLCHGVPTFIEKPVVTDRNQAIALQELLDSNPAPPTLVGCVLRFLPSLIEMRRLIRAGAIGTPARASMQVGQWLPSWRPSADYKSSYSAHTSMGGGVVLDLIHELDAARWLFGEFDTVLAAGGSYSSLGLDTEDAAAILLARSTGPVVAISLDYVARAPMRRYEVIGDQGTLSWDLAGRSLHLATAAQTRTITLTDGAFDVSATYLAAMEDLLSASADRRATSQDVADGLRSALLAIRANEMIRAPRVLSS